jgi:hypothetical protein
MKFLMLIKHSESYRNEAIPQALMDAMGEFVGEGFKSGVGQDEDRDGGFADPECDDTAEVSHYLKS